MIQKITTPYGTARIYRKYAEAPRRIMIVPGYSESISHNKELVNRLANEGGYDAFTFSQPRRGRKQPPLDRQRAIILTILDTVFPGGEAVHAAAHSLGSAALLRAVVKNLERFLSVTLMQPSGITGSQSLLQIARRSALKTIKNPLHVTLKRRSQAVSVRYVLRAQLSSAAYVARNPLLALKEANVARKYTIDDDIAVAQARGIPVHIIHAHSDELFKTEHLPEHEQILEMMGSYSSILDQEAGHDAAWLNPERTAQTVTTFIKQTVPINSSHRTS